MLKKTLIGVLALVAFLLLSFFLQEVKRGTGSDAHLKYRRVENWPQLPKDLRLGNPTGISTDTSQNIVVFHRAGRTWPLLGPMPDQPIADPTILILHKDKGNMLSSWGSGLFVMPHGLTVDRQNNIWVTDVGLHQVFKFSHDGKLLLTLGQAKVPGRDRAHFDGPTDIAIAKDGSFYVTDGYGNSRVIKFSAQGHYLFEWGKKGHEAGAFHIPHAITLDSRGHVYVADRENNRIQVFDPNGTFLQQMTDDSFGAIGAVTFDQRSSRLFALDDFTFLKVKHRGSDVLVLDTAGRVRTRFGRSGAFKGPPAWFHDLTVDTGGNLYIGDILGNSLQKFQRDSLQ